MILTGKIQAIIHTSGSPSTLHSNISIQPVVNPTPPLSALARPLPVPDSPSPSQTNQQPTPAPPRVTPALPVQSPISSPPRPTLSSSSPDPSPSAVPLPPSAVPPLSSAAPSPSTTASLAPSLVHTATSTHHCTPPSPRKTPEPEVIQHGKSASAVLTVRQHSPTPSRSRPTTGLQGWFWDPSKSLNWNLSNLDPVPKDVFLYLVMYLEFSGPPVSHPPKTISVDNQL